MHAISPLPSLARPPQAKPPRFDLYAAIHKALRLSMAQALVRLGALDPDDDNERAAVADAVTDLLTLLRGHLQHENEFLHTAIEARRPGAARQTAADHSEHLDSIACLENEVRLLRRAPADERAFLAQRLYGHLAVFVGENLIHMMVEETQNNASLWALYSDEELLALHDRLIASLPPAEMAQAVRWMAQALSVPELTALFADMGQKAPPQAFEGLLHTAQVHMPAARWAALARALGRPPVPGLVHA